MEAAVHGTFWGKQSIMNESDGQKVRITIRDVENPVEIHATKGSMLHLISSRIAVYMSVIHLVHLTTH